MEPNPNEVINQEAPTSTTSLISNSENKSQKSHKALIFLLVILIVLIFAGGIAGGYFLGKNSSSSNVAQVPTPTIAQDMTGSDKLTPGEPKTTDETADWKTYTFPNTTVTFKYPSDWTLKENLQFSPKSITLSKQDTNGTGSYNVNLEVGNIALGGAGSSSSFQNVNQFTINGKSAYILSDLNSSSQPSIYTVSSCDAPKKCLFTSSGAKIDFYANYYKPGSQSVEPIPVDDPRTNTALKILSTLNFTN